MIARTIKRMKSWYESAMSSLKGAKSEKPAKKVPSPRYPVNLCIGEQTLTLNVSEETETHYRETAKRLNDDYRNFSKNYPDAPTEKLLAILALKEVLANKKVYEG